MPSDVVLDDCTPSGAHVWQPRPDEPPYALLAQAVQRLAALHGRPLGRFAAKRLELRHPIAMHGASGWPTTLARLALGHVAGRNRRLA